MFRLSEGDTFFFVTGRFLENVYDNKVIQSTRQLLRLGKQMSRLRMICYDRRDYSKFTILLYYTI